MGIIYAGTQSAIAPIVMKLALSPDGLKTKDLYDDKNLIFRAIHDTLYRPEGGIEYVRYDPNTGRAMERSKMGSEEYEKAEMRWLPVPPTTDEGYVEDGAICTFIEITTDELRDRGWVVYEDFIPNEEIGDQYTIRVTKEGKKRLKAAGNYRSYQDVIL